ncbi:MAG: methyltransferase domain-containing protein [Chloroflexi bacterium]|nr:methyltransferase domain-containing protein [Chloroflexota bacterium]
MRVEPTPDVWANGDAYERFVGRWSRLVATEFLRWLEPAPQQNWLDVGCGTGVLARAIAVDAEPRRVVGIDPSHAFLACARASSDPRVCFDVGDARALPYGAERFDLVVSGLMLNFVPGPAQALSEMRRVVRPGGLVAAYVWDYADEMQLLHCFWDAAADLDRVASELDEGRRFPLCGPEPLERLFANAGLTGVAVHAIEVPTRFVDFEDYWTPFLGGQGPGPTYVASLDSRAREALRERLRVRLPTASDGSINLMARAWAVRGS